MSDHAATLLALGLTLAFATGVLWARFARAMSDLDGARAGVRRALGLMRAARLRFLFVAVIIFAIAWPWLHGYG